MEKPIFSQHLSASLASSFILLISPLVATCRRHPTSYWMRAGGVSRQRLGLGLRTGLLMFIVVYYYGKFIGLLFMVYVDVFLLLLSVYIIIIIIYYYFLFFMVYFFHGISMDILGYELDDNEILDVEPDVVMHN